MKLLALRDTYNVQSLGLKDENGKTTVDGAPNDNHIHKGAVFEMGRAPTLEAMRKNDLATFQKISLLMMSGAVAAADNEAAQALVKTSLAEDASRARTAAERNANAEASHIGEKVIELLTKQLSAKGAVK